eukprot:TRINITY_DN490_c0_g1_i1.p1 TRINITY_DN490_c0_g1~~TRINITY_DN490_c0_g1_i1.p1  ORF type:complete len:460 (+),score=102.64 TRINITY_DN490_c0_g1_i1:74-1453(+)
MCQTEDDEVVTHKEEDVDAGFGRSASGLTWQNAEKESEKSVATTGAGILRKSDPSISDADAGFERSASGITWRLHADKDFEQHEARAEELAKSVEDADAGFGRTASGLTWLHADKDTGFGRGVSHVSSVSGVASLGEELAEELLSPTKSFKSKASFKLFNEPDQTLLFLDWDDTLFPTTELLDVWRVKVQNIQQGNWRPPPLSKLTEERQQHLTSWQGAVQRFLTAACETARCVILTNARPGWVDTCIEQFAPNLKSIFSDPEGPKVVYALDVLASLKMKKKIRSSSPTPIQYTLVHSEKSEEELMSGKFESMRREAKAFYSRYRGQSWKNIISMGDQAYEQDALQELGMRRRAPAPERLRIKTVLLPDRPAMSELALRIDALRILLPRCVEFDGDFNIDLKHAADPNEELSESLNLPSLRRMRLPSHCWGKGPPPANDSVNEVLVELAACLQELEDAE